MNLIAVWFSKCYIIGVWCFQFRGQMKKSKSYESCGTSHRPLTVWTDESSKSISSQHKKDEALNEYTWSVSIYPTSDLVPGLKLI